MRSYMNPYKYLYQYLLLYNVIKIQESITGIDYRRRMHR